MKARVLVCLTMYRWYVNLGGNNQTLIMKTITALFVSLTLIAGARAEAYDVLVFSDGGTAKVASGVTVTGRVEVPEEVAGEVPYSMVNEAIEGDQSSGTYLAVHRKVVWLKNYKTVQKLTVTIEDGKTTLDKGPEKLEGGYTIASFAYLVLIVIGLLIGGVVSVAFDLAKNMRAKAFLPLGFFLVLVITGFYALWNHWSGAVIGLLCFLFWPGFFWILGHLPRSQEVNEAV